MLRINSSGPQAGQGCIETASAVRCNSRCIVLSAVYIYCSGLVPLPRYIPSMVIFFPPPTPPPVFFLAHRFKTAFLFFFPPPCVTTPLCFRPAPPPRLQHGTLTATRPQNTQRSYIRYYNIIETVKINVRIAPPTTDPPFWGAHSPSPPHNCPETIYPPNVAKYRKYISSASGRRTQPDCPFRRNRRRLTFT